MRGESPGPESRSRESGSRESGSRESGSRESGSRESGSRESGSRESWGRYPRPQKQHLLMLRDRDAPLPDFEGTALPHGNGRSYGDSCLNDGGTLLCTRGLDRFIAFDPVNGVLRCEAGVLLADILDLVVGQGWFLPVTPGTKFVTVGGAIANDVHGKNHHVAGCFSEHVRGFELLRSDGTRRWCSAQETPTGSPRRSRASA